MPPRTPNAPFTAAQVLLALGVVMQANTYLQANAGAVLVNTDEPLIGNAANWPALVLAEHQPSTAHIAPGLWQDRLIATLTYSDRYDVDANESLDAIWLRVDADLRRMVANVQDNPALIISGVRYVTDVAQVDLSPFALKQLDKDTYGFPVVQRIATAHINGLPYAAVS